MSKSTYNYDIHIECYQQTIYRAVENFHDFLFQLRTRYAKRKDEELVKNSIGVRRDFEEKMKIERSTLKEVLTNQNKRDLEAAVDRKKLVRNIKT